MRFWWLPLRVTFPPPSIVTLPSAVLPPLFMIWIPGTTMTTGADPQSNVTTPPACTAATTASAVQLAAVPVPTTVVGDETSSASATVGMGQCPSGLPFVVGVAGTELSGVDATRDALPAPLPDPPPPPSPEAAPAPVVLLLHAAATSRARQTRPDERARDTGMVRMFL